MDGQGILETPAASGASISRLNKSRLGKWTMNALMAFPVVDFGLRLHGLHPLGVIWHMVALVILAVLAFLRYLSGYRPQWFSWQKFGVWYMIFGLALMFAGMASPIVAIQGLRIDVYYIFFAFLIPLVIGPDDVHKLLHVGAMVAVLIAIHGIYQYITKAPTPDTWVVTSRTRVYSVLQSPNELGAYMALMTPIIVGLALYETSRWRKRLYLIGALLCACTLVFTFTRGAWVALALSVLIIAVLFERKLLIALVVVGAIAYFLPPIHHRIDELLSPVYWLKSSSSGRISKWLTAFDKMSTNPLFGVGLGHYGGSVSSLYLQGAYSDNYYAKTFGETGLVGLTLLLAMHIAIVRDLFIHSLKRAIGRTRYLMLGGMVGIVAVLIHNCMENVFEFAPMAIPYFIYVALFLVLGRGISKEVAHDVTDTPSV